MTSLRFGDGNSEKRELDEDLGHYINAFFDKVINFMII